MKNPYYFLVASAIFALKNGPLKEAWKFMTLFLLSLGFGTYLASIWLLIDKHYHGFTNFLAIPGISNTKHYALYYLLIYFLLPFLIINYLLIFHRSKYEIVVQQYPKAKNKKYFMFFFLGSYVLGYIVVLIVY